MSNLKTGILALALVLALGYAGHIDYQSALTEQAAAKCDNLDNLSTPTKAECINNQLEQNGDK